MIWDYKYKQKTENSNTRRKKEQRANGINTKQPTK